MTKLVEINECGIYYFKLLDYLNDRNIPVTKLCNETNTDYKVIRRLGLGDLYKLDLYVLARLCSYLKCDMTDIIDYRNND